MQELDPNYELAIERIAQEITRLEVEKGKDLSEREIWQVKLDVCREFGLDRVPKNSDILQKFDSAKRSRYVERLRRKSIRTRSGVAVVTVITKPFDCPHGTCTFCPGGVRFGTPQSYTQNSPAAVFGAARSYEASLQVEDSLQILEKNGHDTSKVEMILLGGTILAMPIEYQREFVKSSYDALNGGEPAENLRESIRRNEFSSRRCVGLTIETKPDWCKQEHIDKLLEYGTTRVEIGVQSLREDVLRIVNRGHSLEDTVNAFQVSKDSCFKTVAHMMPGLPHSNPEKDLQDLRALVSDERYRPDMIKIYPTLVVEGTALYRQYKMGMFTPYSLDQIVDVLSKFKQDVPPWIRIMRIQREIPKEEIAVGAKSGNLRQIVLNHMAEMGTRCRCIRCREVGHRMNGAKLNEATLARIDYESSSGHEVFLSIEHKDSDTLFAFLRLRIPSGREHRHEIRDETSSLVRELHVYGSVVPLGDRVNGPNRVQHQGLGTRLLTEAERIAKYEFARKKQIVISASGTREYYRNRGYSDDGAFVSKRLNGAV